MINKLKVVVYWTKKSLIILSNLLDGFRLDVDTLLLCLHLTLSDCCEVHQILLVFHQSLSLSCRLHQGIRVKKCCASCAHKDLTRALSKRYCSICGKSVEPIDVCESWEMSDQMKIAGLLR